MVDGRDAHGHNALGGVIVIRTGNALREGDAGDGIAAGNGDIGAEGGDGRRVGGGPRQLPGLAHRSRDTPGTSVSSAATVKYRVSRVTLP